MIIPAFGRRELTDAVLGDIEREPWVDAVVVDNGGDHEARHGEHVLRPGSNLGWARGCNYALEQLHTDFDAYVLLNNDTRLSERFFAGLWRAQRQTGAGLVGPMYDGVWAHQHPRRIVEPARYRPRATSERVAFVDGTCLFLPRRTLSDVGLLDAEAFPHHGWGVDFDYALRVRKSGGDVVVTGYSPSSRR